MKYYTRVSGSQRTSKAKRITFEENFAGQGGVPHMAFLDEKGVYHFIVPQNEADVKTLLRQAHVLMHHVKDDPNP